MIKAEVSKAIYKNDDFPKLMIGLRTGAIYLAVGEIMDGSNKEIRTVAISKGHFCAQGIGTLSKQPASLLKDFDGSVTLSNGE